MEPVTTITRDDMADVALGGAFLGTGGGGDPYIGRLMAERDFKTARLKAHALKGAAGNISALDLQRAALRLEEACALADPERIQRRLPAVEAAIRSLDVPPVPEPNV